MRVALAQDRDKTEDVPFHTKPLAIGFDHGLGGQFRRGVERGLHRERRILGRGENGRLAIDRAGGRERDAPHAARAHGFQYVGGTDGVLLQILARMRGAEANVRIGGHMKHKPGVLHGAIERSGIEQIAVLQAESRRAQGRFEELDLSGGEIIEAGDLMPVGEQTVHEVTADESRRAGDQVSHMYKVIGRAGLLACPEERAYKARAGYEPVVMVLRATQCDQSACCGAATLAAADSQAARQHLIESRQAG